MKRIVILALLVFVGVAGWRAGGVLSADAMGLALGVVLGMIAGLPIALLMLAASRRAGAEQSLPAPRSAPPQAGAHSGQPPIIVLSPPAYGPPGQSVAGHPAQLTGGYPGWPQQNQRPERSFTIVGETAEYVDDF